MLTVDTDQAVYTWNPEDCFVIRQQHEGGSMGITSDYTQDMAGAAATIDRWIALQGEQKLLYCGSL